MLFIIKYLEMVWVFFLVLGKVVRIIEKKQESCKHIDGSGSQWNCWDRSRRKCRTRWGESQVQTTGILRNRGGGINKEDWEKSFVRYRVREQELKEQEAVVQKENNGVSEVGWFLMITKFWFGLDRGLGRQRPRSLAYKGLRSYEVGCS